MEIAALLALLSAGLVEARWVRVDTVPLTLDQHAAVLLDVPGADALRVSCAQPIRHLVIAGVLVEDLDEQAREADDGWWYFTPSELPARQQIVFGDACKVERLEARPSAASFDRLEHTVDLSRLRAIVEQSPAFSERHRRWLSEAVDDEQWRLRYEGLRPARVHQPPGLWTLAPEDGRRVSVEDQRWWEAPGVFSFTGSGRLLVEVLPTTPDRPVCLTVDEQTHCQAALPDQAVTVRDGALAVRSPGGARPLVWRVVLGEGRHQLSLSEAPRARITLAPAHTLDPRAPDALRQSPDRSLLIGPCGEAPCPPPSRRVANQPSADAELLLRPSRAWPPTGPTWVALDVLDVTENTTWQDAEGQLSLWVETRNERCTLTVGDQQFKAIPHRSIAKFFRDTPDSQPPRSDCPAWVRLEPPLAEELRERPRHILSKMSSLGTRSVFDIPEGPQDLHLEVSWPTDALEPVGVEIVSPDGVQALFLRPMTPTSGASTADGRSWTLPIALPLGDSVEHLRFDRSASALVQISSPALPAADDPPPQPASTTGAGPEELLGVLQELSAVRPLDHRARADGLQALGALQLALDEHRLDTSQPRARLSPPGLPGMRDRWLSVSGLWLQGEPRPETFRAAATGDFITVARDPDVDLLDRLLAWRRAILGGQILDASQRIEAYLTLHESLPDEVRTLPSWGSIRALSRWEPIRFVEGARSSRRASAPLTDAERWDLRVSDALFPSRWPPEETLQLGRAALRLPPGPDRTVPVRCRTRRARSEAYEVTVRDGSGEVIERSTVAPFDGAAELRIPGGAQRYVRAEQPELAACQLRLPPEIATDLQGRSGRESELRPGEPVSVTVLGPTVLRVSGVPGEVLSVTHDEGQPETITLDAAGLHEVPVPQAGPRVIRIASSVEQWVRLDLRVPNPVSLSPPSDQRLARVEEEPPQWAVVDRLAVLPLVPRRRHGTPITGMLSAALDAEPGRDGLEIPTPRLASRAGVLSRPGRERLWLGAEAAVILSTEQPVYLARLRVEWVPFLGPWRLALRTSTQLAWGRPDGTPMNTFKGWSTLSVARWISERTRLLGSVTASGRADLSAAGRFNYGTHPELWSAWQQDHLATLHYALRVRTTASRWLWVSAESTAVHDPLGDGVDRLGALGWLELSGPGAWLKIGGGSYFWLQDSLRSASRVEPVIQASGWVFLWPSGDLAVQLRGSVAYWPTQQVASVLLGPTIYFSRDRGLADVPLSHLRARSAAEWGYDGAALGQGLGEGP